MAEFILMPKLGFNMESGMLVKWHKKEGEPVQKGEALFEILTDKTNMVIESSVSGFVRKILAEEGETIPVFLPIAIIGEAGEDIGPMIEEGAAKLGKAGIVPDGDSPSQEKLPDQTSKRKFILPASPGLERLRLSPRARKYIQENNIDTTNLDLKGTGFQGGVTAGDMETYVRRHRVRITPLAEKMAAQKILDLKGLAGTGQAGKITKADVEGWAGIKEGKSTSSPDTPDGRQILQATDYKGMRKIIGDRLSQSIYTAPHIYFTTSLVVDDLLALRQEVNSSQEQKVSLNDFMAAAVIKALVKYPELNSSLQGDKIMRYEDVNLGIAVALEAGLIVPVIKKAQYKRITDIAREGRRLIDKALKGTLLPDEYKGGTFTISNLGMHGIENFTAIINPPEAGILSISAVKKTPVVVVSDGKDTVAIRSVMNITLSVDHRIIDGLMATRFINQIKALIEKPISIII